MDVTANNKLEWVMTYLNSSDIMGEEKEEVSKSVYRTENALKVAFMIGLDENQMVTTYGDQYSESKEKLNNNKNVLILRELSKARSILMAKFSEVDSEIKYNLANIDRMEIFTKNVDFTLLRKNEVDVIKANYTAAKYYGHLSKLIEEYVNKCKDIFDDNIRFDLIRNIFVCKYQKENILSKELAHYKTNRTFYPFGKYIVWNPVDRGNFLESDSRLFSVLYEQNGETFHDYYSFQDASEETKDSIYEFIGNAKKVEIVVDCENVDPYKLYSVLKNLNEDELRAIHKITLFDDVMHGSRAWDYLEKQISIPVEHVEVERVMDGKSLVDMKLIMGVNASFYRECVDSFILCSSDSDFYALISSMPFANFLVMYEYKKISDAMKEKYNQNKIQTCCIDDFYMNDAKNLKKIVLRQSLNEKLSSIIGKDARKICDELFDENYIDATQEERNVFFEKNMKKLRLEIDKNGKYAIVVE